MMTQLKKSGLILILTGLTLCPFMSPLYAQEDEAPAYTTVSEFQGTAYPLYKVHGG